MEGVGLIQNTLRGNRYQAIRRAEMWINKQRYDFLVRRVDEQGEQIKKFGDYLREYESSLSRIRNKLGFVERVIPQKPEEKILLTKEEYDARYAEEDKKSMERAVANAKFHQGLHQQMTYPQSLFGSLFGRIW